MEPAATRPRAASLAVVFFAVCGTLEIALAFADAPRPDAAALWEATGRAVLPALVAAGLWRGFASAGLSPSCTASPPW